MDNILFVPSTKELEWVQDVLPGTSPAELPVAGRRIIDYSFQCAQKFGVMFTEVLDWHFSQRLADDFSDLTRTGYPVFYLKGEGPVPKGLRDIENYSSPLTSPVSDGLVVVWGAAISTHRPDEVSLEPVSEAECEETPARPRGCTGAREGGGCAFCRTGSSRAPSRPGTRSTSSSSARAASSRYPDIPPRRACTSGATLYSSTART